MKILVVSQYYHPESSLIAPGVAEGLAARGHSVRVITGFPNYPAGRLFPGYRMRWRRFEQINGVAVCRVPLVIDHSEHPWRRALNYLTFGLSAATARRFARGADVVYVYATQMTAAMGPWLWRAAGGAPYILHVQDLWPDSVLGSTLLGRRRIVRFVESLLNMWLASVYRRASAVVGIAPRMVETLRLRGVSPGKLELVFNWARMPDELTSNSPEPSCRGTVLFAGNVGDMQDLETAVRAARRLRDSGLVLRVVGAGIALPRVRKLADDLEATNVQFVDRVPPEEMPAFYARADYSLVSLKNLPAFEGTIPSKFQASLAHATPVIVTVPGDLRELVVHHQVGLVADSESVDSLERTFRRALELSDAERSRMAERARELYRSSFSFDSALTAIEEILIDAAVSRKAATR